MPARVCVLPAFYSKNSFARSCTPLPSGMPDCLELSVVRSEEGIERCTTVMYGARAYLIHYAFTPAA